MGKQNKAVTLVLSMLAAPALAGEDVDETRVVESASFIEIINVRGEVDIKGWSQDKVEVSGELDDRAEELVFDVDGSRVYIEVKLPNKDINWGDGSDLQISVPRSARVDFNGVSTDIEIEDVEGGTRIRTVSGDVNAKRLKGQIIVNSVSGEVEVEDSVGDGRVKTVSGEIDINCDCDTLVLDTVSGEIDAKLKSFSSVRATAVNGDVELYGQLTETGQIDMNSVNGDLTIELDAPVDAVISVETGPGGDITNRITQNRPVERFPARMELETVAGDGSGRIKLRTINGDIELKSDS